MKAYIDELNKSNTVKLAELNMLDEIAKLNVKFYDEVHNLPAGKYNATFDIQRAAGRLIDSAESDCYCGVPTLKLRVTDFVSLEHSLHNLIWKYPTLQETHRAAYDVIHAHAQRSAFSTFDSIRTLSFAMREFSRTLWETGATTGRWSSAKQNTANKPKQHVTYKLRPYQQDALDEIRATHAKGWKL